MALNIKAYFLAKNYKLTYAIIKYAFSSSMSYVIQYNYYKPNQAKKAEWNLILQNCKINQIIAA